MKQKDLQKANETAEAMALDLTKCHETIEDLVCCWIVQGGK